MKYKTFEKLMIAGWLVGAIFSLTIMGAIIFVAFHFISKYW